MLPDIQPGNTKTLYFFNCLLDGAHTTIEVQRSFFFSGEQVDTMQFWRSVVKCDCLSC